VRQLLAALVIYLLFLIQASLPPGAPDLVLLALIVLALHEGKLASTLLGTFSGLCLDMTAPAYLGANLLFLTVIGYAVASLRSYFYRGRWSAPLLALGALAVKWIMLLAVRAVPAALVPQLVSTGLTLALSPLAGVLLVRLFYVRWSPGSTD
jgi:rod shape-determining protein MreD